MDVFIDMERLAAYRKLLSIPTDPYLKKRIGHRITAPQRQSDKEKALKRLQERFIEHLMERQLHLRGDL
tara:strand:- start:51952 stop:52158 length:207 start_codon:yes stop_codon:yes gene_type:complete